MLFDAVSELTHLVQAHRFGVHDIQIRHNFRIAADDESALEPEKEHHHAHCLAVRLLEKPTETVVISLTIKGFQVYRFPLYMFALNPHENMYRSLLLKRIKSWSIQYRLCSPNACTMKLWNPY